ncbi:MAG: hypothetical protein V2A55_00740 [Candidatus Jorgensenbacteria bacterium]
MAKKSAEKTKITREQAIKTLRFAQENKLLINPAGMEYYLEGFARFQACPCDTKRPACPCSQALEEIQKEGHCLCRLFWKDYQAYLKEYYYEETLNG